MSSTDATLIVGMFSLLVTMLAVFLPLVIQQRDTRKKVIETREAITNNHTTHLRDDLDSNTQATQDLMKEVRAVRRTQAEYKAVLERHLDDSAEFTESTIRRLRRLENGDTPSPAKL